MIWRTIYQRPQGVNDACASDCTIRSSSPQGEVSAICGEPAESNLRTTLGACTNGTRDRAISTQQRSLVRVMIASPLEAVHVAKIAAAYPEQIELIYRPDLMPSPRYDADHTGDPMWRRSPGQQAEWRALLAQAEVLWDFPVGEEISPLELSPHLQWLQTTSAGVGDRVKQLSLDESDVIITTASGVHARPLAEFVFAALLSHTKRLRHLQAEQQIHHWERFCTRELHGQTMAIIGFGRIGREVAHIARCFGMTIWVMAARQFPVSGRHPRRRSAVQQGRA